MSTVKNLEFSHRIKSILSHQQFLCVQTLIANDAGAQFSLIDVDSHQIINEIEVEVSGIVPKLFTDEVLVVVSYSNEMNPDITDIYGVDWQTGDIIWERPMTKILDANQSCIKLPHRNIQGQFQYVAIQSGEEVNELLVDENPSLEIKYPTGYPESSIYFEWFSKFLKGQGEIPVKHCEYIRLQKQTVLSYYVEQQNTLSNNLIVIDIHGNVLDKFLLESELKGIGKDTFFIFVDQLVFISSQQTLNFYAL